MNGALSRRVLIFGATSRVAGEVAQVHARRGARVHLIGRSESKLAALAFACGPSASTQHADFDDLAGNARVVEGAIRALGGVDVALIAHGDLGDQIESEQSFESAERTLRTNFTSVVSLVIPLAQHMEAARAGSLGCITSVAGDRGRPRNYTYGAAKGAVTIYMQGLRTRVYRAGVRVTTIKLGPVDTPMTRDHKKHMLFGKPSRVARDIVRAMDAGVSEAYVPSFWSLIMPVVKNTPERLIQRLPFLSGR